MIAPLVVVAGTGVDWRLARGAYSSWGGHRVGLPGRGLGSLEGTYRHLEERLVRFYNEHGHFVIAGHSQGALHAIRFALDHPTFLNHAVAVAGPFLGPRVIGPAPLPCVAGMTPGSPFLTDLQDRSRTLGATTFIAGKNDKLVSVASAFGLDVPWARKLVVNRGHVTLMGAPEVVRVIRSVQ